MISEETLNLFIGQYKALGVGGKGNNGMFGTIGIVVDTDDPLQQGRLRVFCPSLNDNPKKIMHLPWCVYLSPFSGSINNKEYTRGTGVGEYSSEGPVHYGFWAIPEVGAHVFVTCIDGDFRRRIWMGCVPEHQETHTILTGRYDWQSEDGTPDGPLTSHKKPIQPMYDNLTEAFGDRKSPEWQSRGAEYQATSISVEEGQNPNRQKGDEYLDDDYEQIADKQKDWVKDNIGSHGYDWSGFKGVGAMKSSRVFGWGTPGMHSFTMDDRPFNSRMKLRTASGHTVLLDDTNDRIYIMTNKGNNWVEMDSNGNIDIFSERRVSINAAKDINMTTGGSFRVHADGGIFMYAGHSVDEYRGTLGVTPKRGEIRIQSEDDIHVLAKNIRNKSNENTYNEIGINRYETVGDSNFMDVRRDVNIRTLEGDYIKTIANDLHETILNNSKRMSFGTNAISSNGNNEMFSFSGDLAIGSQGDTSVKASNGDINVEAVGRENTTGNVNLKTPKSTIGVGDNGVETSTSKAITQKADETISMEIKPGSGPQSASFPGLMGSVASNSVITLAATGVNIQSAMDISFKEQVTGNSNTYSNIVNTLNETVVKLDMLTYYTGALTIAVDALASAVGESFSMPYTFDMAGLSSSIFSGAIPSEIIDMYGSLSGLSNAIDVLGIPGITLPLEINTVVNELEGNVSALLALGLPGGLSFPINPSILGAVDILTELNLSVDVLDIVPMELPDFRSVVQQIFENISSSSPPPTPPSIDGRPPLDPIAE